jgi:hypothetical protein
MKNSIWWMRFFMAQVRIELRISIVTNRQK